MKATVAMHWVLGYIVAQDKAETSVQEIVDADQQWGSLELEDTFRNLENANMGRMFKNKGNPKFKVNERGVRAYKENYYLYR